VDKLLAIVSDSVKINKHKNDPEMVADLYHRIAEGHTTTPDMRVAWLQGLANFHLKQKSIQLKNLQTTQQRTKASEIWNGKIEKIKSSTSN
jgi:hypothetical protein